MPSRLKIENVEIECLCGCGKKTYKYDSRGRTRKGYLVGHYGGWNNGLKRSDEVKEQIRKKIKKQWDEGFYKGNSEKTSRVNKGKRLNENRPNWKGNEVGYTALHGWVKRRKPKPKQCSFCGQEKRLDLANKTGEYLRNVDDWIWLCHRCHLQHDWKNKIFIPERLKERMWK